MHVMPYINMLVVIFYVDYQKSRVRLFGAILRYYGFVLVFEMFTFTIGR